MEQPNLFSFDDFPQAKPADSHLSIEDRFAQFHASNPQVFEAIRAIALDLKSRGWKRAGMKAIFERIRWEYAMRTNGESYLLNNTFTAHYSRLLMDREPSLAGFFETRERRAA